MTLREASSELLRIAREAREIAARIDGVDRDRTYLSAKIRATAYELELNARRADMAGMRAGEPVP